MTPLILQDLLQDDGVLWQVYNCKLTQSLCTTDSPLPFYVHYDTLSDEQKDAYPLDFEQLKRLQEPMTATQAGSLIGADASIFKKSFQIKYIASVVMMCEPLQLALRFHISNTAKSAQAVFVADGAMAWASECERWQAFGVVDILYKGTHALYSHAQDEIAIPTLSQYHALPSGHSLSVLAILNQKSPQLASVNGAIVERLINAWQN